MKLLPLKMKPSYKEYLWGGELLKKEYNKKDAPQITAESWELSSNPDGLSVVDGGIYNSKSLNELFAMDNSIYGSSSTTSTCPVLVKLIDARKDLSIQVHPSDSNAIAENGEHGKEEVWYIVDCTPQSYIYYGFSRKTDAQEVRKLIADGTICSILNKIPVKKGDYFVIKPGTVHAIGAGNFIAEIQQNSNTTFRVFDFNRKGPDGKQRELHIERALAVMNFSKTDRGDCNYFKTQVISIDTCQEFTCDGTSFQHILCVDGKLEIMYENSTFSMLKGESYFLPAGMGRYEVSGKGKLIVSRLP